MPDTHTHTHTHTWGPIQHGRFSGEPHRACDDCGDITLDLYLYCEFCGGPIITTDESGVYRHHDPESPETDLAYWDDDHTIVPETSEAPYDEDEE